MAWAAVTAIYMAVYLFMNGLRLLTQSICFLLPRLTLLDNINDALLVHWCWVSPLSATTIQMRRQWILAAKGWKLGDNCGTIRHCELIIYGQTICCQREKNHSALHGVEICPVLSADMKHYMLKRGRWKISHMSSVSRSDFGSNGTLHLQYLYSIEPVISDKIWTSRTAPCHLACFDVSIKLGEHDNPFTQRAVRSSQTIRWHLARHYEAGHTSPSEWPCWELNLESHWRQHHTLHQLSYDVHKTTSSLCMCVRGCC